MRGSTRILVFAREPIGKDDVIARSLAIRQRLENDIVSALRSGRPVPRAVEGDEGTPLVCLRELRALVDLEIVGRPVSRERGDWRIELVALADLLAAIAATVRFLA